MTTDARPTARGQRSLRRPDTLTEATSAFIRDAIIRGDHAPGSRLPEAALAQELDVSRGTIREALRALADRGLVEVLPHRGVVVSPLSVRATWEITSMRALLEPYAARLALHGSRGDPGYAASVDEAFGALRAAVDSADVEAVADADVGFHRAVFLACRHQMLLAQLDKLEALSRRLVLTNQLYAGDAPTLIEQHAPIAQAVRDRDADALAAAVHAHVIHAGNLLLARMSAAGMGAIDASEQALIDPQRWPSGSAG
jgi:DNA-binding GntR family transcriptional regulator